MHRPVSLLGAAGIAVLMTTSALFAQETTPPEPAAPPVSSISLESAEGLLASSLEALKEAAEAGNAAASLAVARTLFDDPDPSVQAEGVEYLTAAADAGARSAIEQLGELYASGGYGIEPDPARARTYYEQAVEAGSIEALGALGRLLLNTDFSVEAQDRGRDLLQQAADAGDVSASNFLGELYITGRGVPQDIDRGLQYYSIGLLTGSNGAVLAMGDTLLAGARNLPADPAVALQLFQMSASTGDEGAARRIASMHLRGQGVPQDVALAETMLTELAAAGDDTALVSLGDLYRDGEFVAQDSGKAVDFYEQAADRGNSTGLTRLANIYLNGLPGIGVDIRRGTDYYTQAVDRGSTNAMRSLAELYLTGTNTIADPQTAIDLLTRAASFGDSAAAERLAVIYANNDPFPADYDQVQKYLRLALAMGNTGAATEVASAIATGPLAREYRDDAFELLSSAVDSRLSGAAARLARLQLDGSFPAQGLSGVMSMLNESALGGDTAAARFLLDLYRDGYGLLLEPDPLAANAFLETVQPVLGVEGTAVERIQLLAVQRETPEMMEAISQNFEDLSLSTSLDVLNDLRRNNARAYIYVVQKGLQPLGLYEGPLNGTLDTLTVRALRAACEQAGAVRECAPGPLTSGTARVLGTLIWHSADQPTS